jgi:hypothetical protein
MIKKRLMLNYREQYTLARMRSNTTHAACILHAQQQLQVIHVKQYRITILKLRSNSNDITNNILIDSEAAHSTVVAAS